MISKEIQSIRDEYKKETTLPHSRQGVGHTQYYSEWSEYKMVEQQKEIERVEGLFNLSKKDIISKLDFIESLKCCGNCRHDVNTVTGTGRCFNCSFVKDKPFDLYEDHWEIKDTKS